MFKTKHSSISIWSVPVVFVLLCTYLLITNMNQCYTSFQLHQELDFDFETFSDSNNLTGYPVNNIVPNIIHLIRIQQPFIPFYEMVNIKSIHDVQKPDRLIIHCDNCSLYGKYWDKIKNLPELEVNKVNAPTEVFGKKFGNVWHGCDVLRIKILQNYGGIFLDNDMYLIRSLDPFRKFEMTLGWDENQFLGTQVLIAHRNARFLKLWFECFRDYVPERWYFNAGELPTMAILYKHPEIVHRVKEKFGVHMLVHNLYKSNWGEWTEQYTVHLLMRHRSYLDKESPIAEFDEENIKTYNYTYGAMARKTYYGKPDLIKS